MMRPASTSTAKVGIAPSRISGMAQSLCQARPTISPAMMSTVQTPTKLKSEISVLPTTRLRRLTGWMKRRVISKRSRISEL